MKGKFQLKVEAWKPNVRSKNCTSSLETVDSRNALCLVFSYSRSKCLPIFVPAA